MRTLFSTRKRLNDPVLKRIINYYYITSSVQTDKEYLLTFIDVNATSSNAASAASNVAVSIINFNFFQKLFSENMNKKMETDDATVKNEPSSQSSTVSSTPVPPQSSNLEKTSQTTSTAPAKVKLPSIVLPEVDLYLHLLVLLFAIDKQKYKQVKYCLVYFN
jgi:hypothetical protein